MSYCIMRVEKRKRPALYGLQIEANRTVEEITRKVVIFPPAIFNGI